METGHEKLLLIKGNNKDITITKLISHLDLLKLDFRFPLNSPELPQLVEIICFATFLKIISNFSGLQSHDLFTLLFGMGHIIPGLGGGVG